MKPRRSTVCLRTFTKFWLFSIVLGVAVTARANGSGPLSFNAEVQLGRRGNNPSTPFLRLAPDGRLFAVWTEDDELTGVTRKQEIAATQHASHMKMTASHMRAAFLASSRDAGRTW